MKTKLFLLFSLLSFAALSQTPDLENIGKPLVYVSIFRGGNDTLHTTVKLRTVNGRKVYSDQRIAVFTKDTVSNIIMPNPADTTNYKELSFCLCWLDKLGTINLNRTIYFDWKGATYSTTIIEPASNKFFAFRNEQYGCIVIQRRHDLKYYVSLENFVFY